jgi:hypothetical protein
VPLTPKKQMPQGFRQVVVLSQVPPQVAVAWVLVCSWRKDIALAERTAMNIAAARIFFIIVLASLFWVSSFWPRRRWALRLAIAYGSSIEQAITKTWTFADVGAGARASTRQDGVRACS